MTNKFGTFAGDAANQSTASVSDDPALGNTGGVVRDHPTIGEGSIITTSPLGQAVQDGDVDPKEVNSSRRWDVV